MILRLFLFVVIAVAVASSCGGSRAQHHAFTSSEAGVQCHVRGTGLFVLPDKSKACTPGEWVDSLRDAQKHVCTPGWNEARPGATALKKIVMALYGVPASESSNVESDHYFPVWLGGATTRANLWPEPNYPTVQGGGYSHNPKDALEVGAKGLYRRVCQIPATSPDHVSVGQARRAFEGNWVTSYRKYVGPTTPAS